LPTETAAYVAVLDGADVPTASKIIREFREEGVNLAVGRYGRKLQEHFKAAEKKGIEQLIIIGQKELEDNQLVLKNLATGQEERHGMTRIASLLQDHRRA
jgi:histidyl-tRNA synthetase